MKNIRVLIVCLVLFLLLSAAAVALFLHFRTAKKRAPTVPGWHSVVTRLTGSGAPGFQDSPGAGQAQFQDPFGVAMDAQGNLYVSDAGENNRIRKIAPGGAVTTLAGGREGFADGAGALGSFNTPSGLAVDFAGNIYVADTGNNRIRKVTPAGLVSTLAGDGTAGLRDGPAASAQLNAPLGVAADARGNVYVADTYNDCIRLITPDGQVRTVAGGAKPGYMDGAASEALFDTPCSVVVTPAGELFVADTGNQRIRKITKDGQVTTLPVSLPEGLGQLASPVGLALTHDGFLYVTEKDRGRVLQVAPDGRAYLVAGLGSGFADGDGQGRARFNRPAGVAIGADGALYVADGANYLVRKIAPAQGAQVTGTDETGEVLPRLSAQTIAAGGGELPWPVDPQRHAHEVVATVGEVRGSYEGEARDHLHSGLDIQAPMGATVRVIYEEKVTDPLCNWGFGELSEGLRAGLFSYIHMRVGLDKDDRPLKDSPFTFLRDEQGKVSRVRVKRGTRLRVGDALGSVNKMYHVHLNFGPPRAEANALALPLIGFSDHVSPHIERDGVQLFDEGGGRLSEKRQGRLVLKGKVRIVVDAYDQVDGNAARRRLGLYKLGYQLLRADGSPAQGFEQPRITIQFDRLPADPGAVKIAYADTSGITVYGSAQTKFLYEVTNSVRDGEASTGYWNTAEIPEGDYTLRIVAADLAGNEAEAGRDVPVTIQH